MYTTMCIIYGWTKPSFTVLPALVVVAGKESILYEVEGMHANVSYSSLLRHIIVIAIILTRAHQHSLTIMSTSRGAGEFREQGNRLFSERRYTEAIEAYTSAIVSEVIYVGQYAPPQPPCQQSSSIHVRIISDDSNMGCHGTPPYSHYLMI